MIAISPNISLIKKGLELKKNPKATNTIQRKNVEFMLILFEIETAHKLKT